MSDKIWYYGSAEKVTPTADFNINPQYGRVWSVVTSTASLKGKIAPAEAFPMKGWNVLLVVNDSTSTQSIELTQSDGSAIQGGITLSPGQAGKVGLLASGEFFVRVVSAAVVNAPPQDLMLVLAANKMNRYDPDLEDWIADGTDAPVNIFGATAFRLEGDPLSYFHGGPTSPSQVRLYEYDGALDSWTQGPDSTNAQTQNTPAAENGASAVCYHRGNTQVESYNGTAWSSLNDFGEQLLRGAGKTANGPGALYWLDSVPSEDRFTLHDFSGDSYTEKNVISGFTDLANPGLFPQGSSGNELHCVGGITTSTTNQDQHHTFDIDVGDSWVDTGVVFPEVGSTLAAKDFPRVKSKALIGPGAYGSPTSSPAARAYVWNNTFSSFSRTPSDPNNAGGNLTNAMTTGER